MNILLGWLIPLGYMGGAFGTWIGGAVRIGARFEQMAHNAHDKAKKTWTIPQYIDQYTQSGLLTNLVGSGFATFLAGLLWPVAIPIFLAFNKGKGLGLKKKQMKLLLEEAEAEIVRIKKKEGWS